MDSTNSTQIIWPDDYIIWILNEKASENNIPAIIFIGVMMLLGVFGNGFTIYVFHFRFKQTSIHILISWLALFDIISCFLSMPFELFEMRFPLMYGEPVSCKVFRIIGFTAAMTSATIMIFIAFDRYYTLCNPFHKFSAKKAKNLIFVGFLIAVMFAWPSALIMGSRNIKTDIPGIVGTDCSYDESMVDTVYPTVYYFILSFTVILCIIILTVVYIKIGIGIWRWKHSDIGDPLTDISSVSTVEGAIYTGRKKRYRSHSLPPSENSGEKLQNGMELHVRNSKVPDTVERCDKQGSNNSNSKVLDSHRHCDNLSSNYENGVSESKQLSYMVTNSEAQEPINNINTSMSKRRVSEISNVNKAFSMENISELNNTKPERDTFMRRNSSLPDMLNNVTDDKTGPQKPVHGILVHRQNLSKSDYSHYNEIADKTNNNDHKKLFKRISSVDFKIDNQEKENINLTEQKNTTHDGVHLRFDNSISPSSNKKKLRKCVSLEGSEMLAVKKGLRPISFNNIEMPKKPFLRQSSSSSVRSFKRQNSVKDKARIGRSNAIFVAITVVFIMSYIPFFALEILKRTNVLKLDTSLAIKVFEVCTKSQYLNNVANPLIYGMLNSKYRREIRLLFFKK